ncbi:MAG: alpha/beta fold hydrolase [Candidatus Dojkabacteria bacterium]
MIFAFPSSPHSGLYFLRILNHYDLSKIKFITFDLPGWAGYSENIFQTGDFDIDEYVDIAKKILIEHKIKDFSVMGYSFGGSLALKLASEANCNVKKIALISTIIHPKFLQKHRLSGIVKVINFTKSYFLLKLAAVKMTQHIIKGLSDSKEASKEFLEIYLDMVKNINSRVASKAIYKFFKSDYSNYLNDIKDKKILIINSKDEYKIFREQADYLRRTLVNKTSIITSGSHDDFILKPKKEVVNKIIDFLIK